MLIFLQSVLNKIAGKKMWEEKYAFYIFLIILVDLKNYTKIYNFFTLIFSH